MKNLEHELSMTFQDGEHFAARLDGEDTLAKYRECFFIPKDNDGNDLVYFCGNSLGLQPKAVRTFVEQELKNWEALGVGAHFAAKTPWMEYQELLREPTARLVGAGPMEIVVMNALTVNLHLMLVSFYRPTAMRHKIVMECKPFPSDRYAVESQIVLHGFDPQRSLVELKPRGGEATLRTEDIEGYLETEGDEVALVLLGGVNYYTGQAFDLERIAKAAHAQGCLVGLDLAHAAGNLPLRLHDWEIDFAVWCSYKYLNGGPGSIAGCFVHERHARRSDLFRLAGWWGQDRQTRFTMEPAFSPMEGAAGWQVSNPPILALAAMRASLEIFDAVGMAKLRTKSLALTNYAEYRLDQLPSNLFSIITPRDPQRRGCQLSIRMKAGGRAIFEHLIRSGVVCDWREPDVIRIAPVPLYNSFSDVHRFAEILKAI